MKRSEFLKKLTKIVEDYQGGFGEYHEEEATYILHEIEKLGMLPPSTDYFINNHPDEMHWEEVADYHRWEPENDQESPKNGVKDA